MSADEYANQRQQWLSDMAARQQNAYVPLPQRPPRPQPIDPKAKLSPKAALLLSINHVLRPA